MSVQLTNLKNKSERIKRYNPSGVLILAWLFFITGAIQYFVSITGIDRGSVFFKEAFHGLFGIIVALICFAEYNLKKQKKLDLEILEKLEELERKITA